MIIVCPRKKEKISFTPNSIRSVVIANPRNIRAMNIPLITDMVPSPAIVPMDMDKPRKTNVIVQSITNP
jgi:regulator of PEP synthase PpsR (kinase-PPPase family)